MNEIDELARIYSMKELHDYKAAFGIAQRYTEKVLDWSDDFNNIVTTIDDHCDELSKSGNLEPNEIHAMKSHEFSMGATFGIWFVCKLLIQEFSRSQKDLQKAFDKGVQCG